MKRKEFLKNVATALIVVGSPLAFAATEVMGKDNTPVTSRSLVDRGWKIENDNSLEWSLSNVHFCTLVKEDVEVFLVNNISKPDTPKMSYNSAKISVKVKEWTMQASCSWKIDETLPMHKLEEKINHLKTN